MASALKRQGSNSDNSETASALGHSPQVETRAERKRPTQPRTSDGLQRRALAPPADILPSSRRRTHHSNAPPGYKSAESFQRAGPKQRTASQNAAMEADAVETLLFMASPGNSGHLPSSSGAARMSAPTSSQTSPLKAEFSSQELNTSPRRRVGFANISRPVPPPIDISNEFDDIDRMIDEMDDTGVNYGLDHVNSGTVRHSGVK
jgi:hypothetical protein